MKTILTLPILPIIMYTRYTAATNDYLFSVKLKANSVNNFAYYELAFWILTVHHWRYAF
jgi:hypothetical protein